MFAYSFHSPLKLILTSGAALSLAACGSSGSYRVASVGSVPADAAGSGTGQTGSDGATGSTGSTGSSGSNGSNGGNGSTGGTGSNGGNGMTTTGIPVVTKVLVTAGNTVIGISSRHNALADRINGLAPGTTNITGTVTTVLRKTGQTLVDLGQGQSLILGSASGKLGEVVKIDLLSNTVVAANPGSSLLGVSVLSPTVATGSLAAVNVGNAGPVLTVGSGSTASGVLSPVNGVLTPVNAVGAPVTGVLVPVVGQVAGPLTGSITGAATRSSVAAPGVVGNVVGGLLGGLKGGK